MLVEMGINNKIQDSYIRYLINIKYLNFSKSVTYNVGLICAGFVNQAPEYKEWYSSYAGFYVYLIHLQNQTLIFLIQGVL